MKIYFNPLQNLTELPSFSIISPEHIVPAINSAIFFCKKTIEEISKLEFFFDWDNSLQNFLEKSNDLNKICSVVHHLNVVQNNEFLRREYNKSLILLSEYNSWIGQHYNFYLKLKKLKDSDYFHNFNKFQRRFIKNTLKDFCLSGIFLSSKKKDRYKKIISQLSQLSSMYNENVLDSTVRWKKLIIDLNLLSGIPEDILSYARLQAKLKNKKGWLLNLDTKTYQSILTNCDNSSLRKEFYTFYNTRASDQVDMFKMFDNTLIIEKIILLRAELADLLGYETYIDKSVATKMMKSSSQILKFLTNLIDRIFSKGKKEWESLQEFSRKFFNKECLKPWDIAYFSEKQKKYIFSIDDEQLKEYFPVSKVLNGLFKIIKIVFGVKIKEFSNVDVWNMDVKFFRFFNEKNELLGSLYLDLYTRKNKCGGAWMSEYSSLMKKSGNCIQKPVVFIVCNFSFSSSEKEKILLTHNEVITIFHEFGHALQHILTCVDIPEISGTNGIPWDAIEVVSQFMENFCWEPNALKLISENIVSKLPLSDLLIEKLLKTRSFQSSLFILRQIELSLFDFHIHNVKISDKKPCFLEIFYNIKKNISILPFKKWTRISNTFNHIFSGSYAAGYYSYLWANVLSSDIWLKFVESGIFNRKIGEKFVNDFLSRGGSEDPLDLFVRFMNRKPKIDSMLSILGLE